jgi:hypothetical protein
VTKVPPRRSCSYLAAWEQWDVMDKAGLFTQLTTIFYRSRLIDDAYIFQLYIPSGYTNFLPLMDYFGQDGAQLEWESSGPSCAIDCLDINIQLNQDGSLITSRFQHPMNLSLF